MHYLVTGHTGFKGAWLVLMLKSRGHKVSGLALDPIPGSLFETAKLAELLEYDYRVDIRDAQKTAEAIKKCAPDVVMHLAAQPLVRYSYENPRETFETNAIGTLNVLEAVANTPSVQAQVVVTTDKVYRNVNRQEGYREDEPLGGDDPYSSSKAMADILTQSWVKSFPGVPTAVARAGNVIGGGDVSKDRLFVDLISNLSLDLPTSIRYPAAVRPWQHVLDCLNGYYFLAQNLLAGKGQGEWNFGPGEQGFVTVGEIATKVVNYWGPGSPHWVLEVSPQPHEAELLALDATKAELQLGWKNQLSVDQALQWTVDWQKQILSGCRPLDVSQEQLNTFLDL